MEVLDETVCKKCSIQKENVKTMTAHEVGLTLKEGDVFHDNWEWLSKTTGNSSPGSLLKSWRVIPAYTSRYGGV